MSRIPGLGAVRSDQAMSLKRIAVKARLLHTRKVFLAGRMVNRCSLCGSLKVSDLHELLVERDDAGGNDELMRLVLESPPNLDLLCNPCNIGPAKETLCRDFLIAKQIYRFGLAQCRARETPTTPTLLSGYGLMALEGWLDTLPIVNRWPFVLRVRAAALALNIDPRIGESFYGQDHH